MEKKEHCLRVLLEPNEKTVEAATAKVNAIETILDNAVPLLPRLLHGLDDTTWAMLELAAKRGYDTRIGFEDSAFLPDGIRADYNEQLVIAAVEVFHRYAA